eukprot:6673661-Pyramimonas_sp.AAC.1
MATLARFATPAGSREISADLRALLLSWTSQKPAKMATLARFATPQKAARSRQVRVDFHSAGPLTTLQNGDNCAFRSPARNREV